MNKNTFINAGMENEGFINYGFEDAERKFRLQKLGHEIAYIKGFLYHLYHGKTIVSSHYNAHHDRNQELFNRVRTYNKKQMQQYVKDVLQKQ